LKSFPYARQSFLMYCKTKKAKPIIARDIFDASCSIKIKLLKYSKFCFSLVEILGEYENNNQSKVDSLF
jgi:hypothetical protein